MKADTIGCYFCPGIAESLHAYITRARLTACEVGVFLKKISQLSKIRPPPTCWNYGSSSPMGIFSRDYSISITVFLRVDTTSNSCHPQIVAMASTRTHM